MQNIVNDEFYILFFALDIGQVDIRQIYSFASA